MKIAKNRFRIPLFLAAALPLVAGAAGAWVDGGGEHQVFHPRPIPLGITGGNINDEASLFCCGGTLGALVQDAGGNLYILSNNHVLARANQADIGDAIIQPGLLDQTPVCANDELDTVAHLSAFVPLDFGGTNIADAAIAQIVTGAVDPSGEILDIGTVSPDTLAPTLGLNVMKSGRTTGFTTGSISNLDLTVSVPYPKKCGGSGGPSALFTGQFGVTPGSFSTGGDSGALVVSNGPGQPQAVGLLFAGSSSVTICNPIDGVLNSLGVFLVGGDPPATGTVAGVVTNADTGQPISGATVSTDTGQSDTTAGDGSYSIANVPTGSRTVTASASGFASDSQPASVLEGQTTIVDFALAPLPTGSQAIVDCVTYTTSGGKGGNKDLLITISVVDDQGAPVANADVTIVLTPGGTGTGATGTNGEVTFRLKNADDTCYATQVTDVVAAGLSWDGATPANGFLKGTDPTPDSDCRSGGDGCGGGALGGSSGGGLDAHPDALEDAIRLKRTYEVDLFMLPDVVAVGVARMATGEPGIEVWLQAENPTTRALIPERILHVPVRVVVSGPIVPR